MHDTVFIIIVATCCYYEMLFISLQYQVIHVWSLGNLILEGWRSGEIAHCQVCIATLGPFIATVDLGPSLLNDDGPYFAFVGLGKSYLVALYRDELIDEDLVPGTVLAQLDAINALIIQALSNEKLLYAIRFLGKSAQNTQEVTISKGTLLDVRGQYGFVKDLQFTFDL